MHGFTVVLTHTLLQSQLSWQQLKTHNQQTNWYYHQCPVVVAVAHLHHPAQEKGHDASEKDDDYQTVKQPRLTTLSSQVERIHMVLKWK